MKKQIFGKVVGEIWVIEYQVNHDFNNFLSRRLMKKYFFQLSKEEHRKLTYLFCVKILYLFFVFRHAHICICLDPKDKLKYNNGNSLN